MSKILSPGTKLALSKSWKRQVLCGKHGPGCGATILITFPDVYKMVIKSLVSAEKVRYETMCPCCHEAILLELADLPFTPKDLPDKKDWLLIQRDKLVLDYYNENFSTWTKSRATLLRHDVVPEDVLESLSI
jgi:hypothetical protein